MRPIAGLHVRPLWQRPDAAGAIVPPSPDDRLLVFGRAVCGEPGQAERREWWLANGLGGYAGGTIAGSLTRRYHGLLIAPVEPPLGRRLVLAKADATLLGPGGLALPLFSNRWKGGAVAPLGTPHIESFRLERLVPVWTYAAAGRRIEQRIWMEPGANTTYVAWRLLPDGLGEDPGWSLRITLLANHRGQHDEAAAGSFDPQIDAEGETLRVTDPGLFTLTITASGGSMAEKRDWYRDFDLIEEAERGLGCDDNHLCVGELTLPLASGEDRGFVASLAADPSADIAAALQRRHAYEASTLAQAEGTVPALRSAPPWIKQLVLAADAFLFARPLPDVPDGESVIAGYPWFGDWGRDTMISLPGLTLATGRPEVARRILTTFARFVSEGMLPNVFPGAGDTAEYNTADAALWYFEAWHAYVETTSDEATLRRVFPVLADMVAWHVKGTRYGIGVDPSDGLLRAGVPGIQVTWMDAKVGDWVVTPRIGKPVEINALWYNALRVMAGFAHRLGEADRYSEAADQAQKSFTRFIRQDGQGLYDVIDGPAGDDTSIRPNQIFAVSLPNSALGADAQRAVVATCAGHLLTSYGLRSLAPDSPGYCGTYAGGVRERDGSYHQGPVWGWLLGPFALAACRVTGDACGAQALLQPMADALRDAGIGTIGEIFDGDPPHRPRGAPAQAWSVGCTLDAWLRLELMKQNQQPAGARLQPPGT